METLILTSLTLQFKAEANCVTKLFIMLLVGSVDPALDMEIAALIKLGALSSVLKIQASRAPADCLQVRTLSYLSTMLSEGSIMPRKLS